MKGEVSVSSDVLGLFADPMRVQHLYEEAGFKVAGLELLPMPAQDWILKEMSRGRMPQFRLTGIHGQLGSSPNHSDHEKGLKDWLLINLADKLIPRGYDQLHTPFPFAPFYEVLPMGLIIDMGGHFLDRDLYLNVHNTIVQYQFASYLQYSLASAYSHLTIENGQLSRDGQSTVELIERMRNAGAIRTTGTLDLVHLIVGYSQEEPSFSIVSHHWGKVLRFLEKHRQYFRHLHFPLGTKKDDSLPILEMLVEKKMLTDLFALIEDMEVTIENQHSLLFGCNWRTERERLRQIYLELQNL